MGQSRVGARASDPAADGRMATSVRADMSRAEDDRSSVATPAGDASVSSWSSSEALFARAASPPLADIRHFHNMSTKEFDAYAYSLNQSQTGCYRQGALPLALAKNDTCLDGFFCPHSSDEYPPQYCPPKESCQILRLATGVCEPQGFYEPGVCSKGFYCPPSANGKEKIQCPAGTFCPLGSRAPFNCTYGAICPEGSERQIVTVPVLLMAVIDVVLGIVVAVGFAISKRRKSRPKIYASEEGGDKFELLQSPAPMGCSLSPPRSPPGSVGGDDRGTLPQVPPPPPPHHRPPSGRAAHVSGDGDTDGGSQLEDPLQNSPDMQRFICSLSRTIETNSIGLAFDFENLSYTTRKGKQILQEVTGTMRRGSCWGVMGGSGAGKSTFVNVLMGKINATSGTIKINGQVTDMHKYKKLIGYVPQDDVVFPELTVRENILHSARVRLPARWRDRDIQDHVDSLIACLQLTHVQHSCVGDARKPVISGGQRKRVNIGMELAAAPMAIFLDEPTSGLDATSAATIMKLLRAISRLGVTVIAIIHQPRERIFYGFDQLLLLADGRSVYRGPTEDVQGYFETLGFTFPPRANPADTLIDIITGDGAQYIGDGAQYVGHRPPAIDVDRLITEWKCRGPFMLYPKDLSVGSTGVSPGRHRGLSDLSDYSSAEQEGSLRRTMKARGASWPAQLYYCWKRAMTQQVRNSTSFFFEIAVGGLAGIIIGLSAFTAGGHLFQGVYHPPFSEISSAVDYQSTPQMGLLGAMAIGLAASAPGFWVFGEEKMMYYRETASGHSRSAYYVGKVFSTLLRVALSSLHFTVFLGILATPMISFSQMYLANLMYFWCVYGLASIVSMVVKREDGPLLAVLASLVIGILGGVAPPLSKVKSWHMEWFWRLSPGVWFTEAYVTENFTPLGYLYVLDVAKQSLGFTLDQYALDIGMLCIIGIVYRIVAYLFLIFTNRDKRR